MNRKLFRIQALEHKKDVGFGTLIVVPKLRSFVAAIFFFIWLPALLFWLCMANFTKRETVSGWIYPEAGTIKVFSPRDGVVKEIYKQDGELVKAGDPILMIGSTASRSESGVLYEELRNEYLQQINSLQSKINNSIRNKKLKLDDIERRILAGKVKNGLLLEQVKLLKNSLEIHTEQKHRMEALMDKGYIGKVEFENIRSTEVDRNVALKKAENELAELESQNRSFKSEKALVEIEAEEEVLSLESQKSLVKEKISQINNQASILITAEADGHINNLQISKGKFVASSSDIPLLSITPLNSKMVGQLFIPVRSVGFVLSNQMVRLKYDAFPYQKYGVYKGRLTKISEVAILPREIENSSLTISEGGFLATVELDDQSIRVANKSFSLKAGMTFSSDITLDRQRLLYWLFQPLLSVKHEIDD